MTKKLQNKIFKRFPQMFMERKLPCTETCMCWGIACGDGWFQLIWDLCLKIEKHTKKIASLYRDFRVTQVKEKCGTIRFYTNKADYIIDEYIDEAEYASSNTCEECGTTETVIQMREGWCFTLCSRCTEERNNDKF